MILVLDDAHWIDARSLQLVERLLLGAKQPLAANAHRHTPGARLESAVAGPDPRVNSWTVLPPYCRGVTGRGRTR